MLYWYILDIGRCSGVGIGIGREKMVLEHLLSSVPSWRVTSTPGQKAEEPLEPEEQQKKEIHCQKQAAYSARILYGLQQQVITPDQRRFQSLDSGSPFAVNLLMLYILPCCRLGQRHPRGDGEAVFPERSEHQEGVFNANRRPDPWHKASPVLPFLSSMTLISCLFAQSKAVDRLAAAHRSALRAMRVFTQQLSEPPMGRVPSHHRELSQVLRLLALCAAKVEVDPGSTVPATALEVLQRLEVRGSCLWCTTWCTCWGWFYILFWMDLICLLLTKSSKCFMLSTTDTISIMQHIWSIMFTTTGIFPFSIISYNFSYCVKSTQYDSAQFYRFSRHEGEIISIHTSVYTVEAEALYIHIYFQLSLNFLYYPVSSVVPSFIASLSGLDGASLVVSYLSLWAVYLTPFRCSLQTLDSAFSNQDRSQQRQAPARSSSSPPRRRSPAPRHMSTPRAPGGAPIGRGLGRHKAVGPRKSIHGKHARPAQNDTAGSEEPSCPERCISAGWCSSS